MSQPTQISNSMYCFLPTEVEGLDSLVELALDMRWSWNHYADDVWRQLDLIFGNSPTIPGLFSRRSRGTGFSKC